MARRRYHLNSSPVVYTLMQIGKREFQLILKRLDAALACDPIDPMDFCFDGISPDAWKVLAEQGRRGPMLALQRILQAQAKSLRLILFVGDGDEAECAYLSHLVGDWFTNSGVPLLWPSNRRFVPPLKLCTGDLREYLLAFGMYGWSLMECLRMLK